MLLKHNRSLIDFDTNAVMMIARGYAYETLVNIALNYFNQDGTHMTVAQRSAVMEKLMDEVAKKIPLYQYRDNSLRFNTPDWDLHVYCRNHDEGVEIEGKRLDLSYILLSFNDLHDVDKRIAVYEAFMDAIKPYAGLLGLEVSLRYKAEYDKDRIKKDVQAVLPKLMEQKVTYAGMTGKIIRVEENQYGFMKSRCRKRYYPLTNNDLLRMAWALEG